MVAYIAEKIKNVYPGGHLLIGGSSTSRCGTIKADLDLCWAVRTHDPEQMYPDQLPIEQYAESEYAHYFYIHLTIF